MFCDGLQDPVSAEMSGQLLITLRAPVAAVLQSTGGAEQIT